MRFHRSALLSAILLACAGAPALVHAVSMDRLESSSALGQNFSGRVLLRGSADYVPNVSCIKVEAADAELPTPGPMRVSVKQSTAGWIISLRSLYPVNEPAFQFRLIFDCYGEQFTRDYSVLLDPPADLVQGGSTGEDTAESTPRTAATVPSASAKRPSSSARRSAGKSSVRKSAARRASAAGGGTASAPARTQPASAGPARDAVKLAVVPPGSSAAAKREAELMALAEDQAAQLRQMEQRITELQAVIAKMQPYVPAEDAARLQVPGAAPGAAPQTASAAVSSAAPAAVASAAAAASTTVASAPAASAPAAAASQPAASARAASAPEAGKQFDWTFWVFAGAAGLGILAFLAYVMRQKSAEKSAAWGNEVTEELLDSYAPVRRAELAARFSQDGDAAAAPAAPVARPVAVPGIEVTEEEAPHGADLDVPLNIELPPATPPAAAPVDVQQPTSVLEEAEWLLSHGEGERAIGLLREEIRNHPEQTETWLALFDCLYQQKKNLEFVTLAHRFRRQATGTDAWKTVCDLGLKLDPENRLFLSRNL